MGVTGFRKFLTYIGTDITSSASINTISCDRIVIDGTQRLYKQCIGRRSNGHDMYTSDGKSITHLYAMFTFAIGMLEMGIKQVYVFDGKSPIEKGDVIEERKAIKTKAQNAYENTSDKTSPDAIKNFKRSFHLKQDEIADCMKILKFMGIPYIIAPGEADQQCAMVSNYYKMNVMTDDSDILVFGGNQIVTNFSFKTKQVNNISREDILTHMLEKANAILTANNMDNIMNITHDNFVDFCILMGTDYKNKKNHYKIIGIQQDKLFELFVVNNFSIEKLVDILKQDENVKIPENFVEIWQDVKKVYNHSTFTNPQNINVHMEQPQIKELIDFLCIEHEFDKFFVLSKLKILDRFKSEYDNLIESKLICDNKNVSNEKSNVWKPKRTIKAIVCP